MSEREAMMEGALGDEPSSSPLNCDEDPSLWDLKRKILLTQREKDEQMMRDANKKKNIEFLASNSFGVEQAYIRERVEKNYFEAKYHEAEAELLQTQVRLEKAQLSALRRSARLDLVNRQKEVLARNCIVTEEWIDERPSEVVDAVNAIDGPMVYPDTERGYGLFAERDYRAGEIVTFYGGVKTVTMASGDYVAKSGELYIDGHHGFMLHEKGRWINESDCNREYVNCSLGRTVRTICNVLKGDQFFADYGDDYVRNY